MEIILAIIGVLAYYAIGVIVTSGYGEKFSMEWSEFNDALCLTIIFLLWPLALVGAILAIPTRRLVELGRSIAERLEK